MAASNVRTNKSQVSHYTVCSQIQDCGTRVFGVTAEFTNTKHGLLRAMKRCDCGRKTSPMGGQFRHPRPPTASVAQFVNHLQTGSEAPVLCVIPKCDSAEIKGGTL